MTSLLAVSTTRSGQTSTFWATALAWSLAESRRVVLVDCDMEGGTVADLLFVDVKGRSLTNCFGERPATVAQLVAQTVVIPHRPNLRVVPGLRESCGLEVRECMEAVGPGLQALDCDVVIADLGHPFAHAALRSPRAAAQAVCAVFHRLFIVIRDEPALLARSIDILRAARPPHGEIVLCHQRSGAQRRLVVETLEREIPDLPIRNGWRWDPQRASQAADSGRPMPLNGAVEELYL